MQSFLPVPAARIEPADCADADLLAALHGRCFVQGWETAAFRRLMQQRGSLAYLAWCDARPAGFLLARLVAGEGEVLSVGVVPESTRQGVARRLLSTFIADARGALGERLHLEVAAGNTAGLALYRALGFTEVGRRKAYYLDAVTGRAEDALTMALAL